MRLKISSSLNAPADHVWALVKKSSTLLFVARGLLGFSGAERFPPEWIEGSTVQTRLLLLGLFPAWKHSLTFQEINDSNRVLYTNEEGGFVTVWNHRIRVDPAEADSCIYSDELEIEAGAFTPLVWLFAHLFYRYRQLRWRLLLRQP